MEGFRRRIDEIVEDPETAEKLKPWYGKHCKRLCFHDEYLPAFNQPNVHLVDTDGRGVREMSAAGPSSTAPSTRSTCWSSRPASRSRPAWSTASGSTRSAAAACA